MNKYDDDHVDNDDVLLLEDGACRTVYRLI